MFEMSVSREERERERERGSHSQDLIGSAKFQKTQSVITTYAMDSV